MEHNRNRQQVWWAVLASIALHAVVGLSLAAFAGRPVAAEEETSAVPQLTIVEPPEPTPPVKRNVPMATVERKSEQVPARKDFEANENSVAAAETAPTKNSILPGQDGKDRPFTNLEEHDESLGKGAQAQPQSNPKPTATPEKGTSTSDQLALLTQTPTPVPAPDAEINLGTPTPTPSEPPAPQKPDSAYRDFQQKTIIRGGINNRGRAAINAVGTPLGRYKKMLEDAIGSRWYYYMRSRPDLASIGTTTLTFDILPDGSIQNLHVTENTTTETSASFAIRSVQEAKFPPIPEDLVGALPEGRYTMEETFTIFANR